MKTLNISISELEFNKFGLSKEKLSFKEFIELVSQEFSRQTLNKCMELSDKHGLSKMTIDEISKEVKAVRRNAKGRN